MKKSISQSTLDAKGMLHAAGFRATKMRIAVLEYLDATSKPVSAKEVFSALQKKGAVDKVTIYRILNGLVETGLAHIIDFRHGHTYYEIATREHHHHIICEICKSVSHIDCNISDIQKEAKRKAKFATIRQHSLEFFGTCNACYTNEA